MTPLLRGVAALARAQVALNRATSQIVDIVGGIAVHALLEAELNHLGTLIYDAGSLHRSTSVEPWEHDWWSAALPKEPGRILVAACGAGREVAWLLERGWEVEAFDPAPSLVELARSRAAGRARIDVLDFSAFAAQVTTRSPFDAVLIGFGGFSHCMSEGSRRRLLQACVALCPRGPILLSWQDGAGWRGHRGRAQALGARIGGALGALRGVGGAWRDRLLFLPHAGPTAFLEAADVEQLATSLGRRLRCRTQPMPHGELMAGPRAPRERTIDDAAVELLAEVLSTRGRHRMVARGGSMKPAIPSGAEVHMMHGAVAQLGDVVAARVHGALIVHRVVGIDAKGTVLLKGDACPAPDGWVAPRDILAIVEAVDVGGGPHAVGPPSPAQPRWRRAVERLGRARRALLMAGVER